MELVVERKYKKDEYTVGNLYVDGVLFCNTIEDKDRGLSQSMTLAEIKSKKVYGKTAIPTGNYIVAMTYSAKFKKMLPLICGVKGYDGIRIHSGNTADDSLGCIIVGENKIKGGVINSRKTIERLIDKISDNNVTITIR